MSPDSVFKFLCHTTSSELTSKQIAKELSKNPRRASNIQKTLIQRMSKGDDYSQGYDRFMTWFHDDKAGYRSAYTRYYLDEIWGKAKNLDELLKQSPNVAPWEMKGKAQELNQEFIFGEVPEEFKDLKAYRRLIEKIKDSEFYRIYVKTRDFEVQHSGSDPMLASTKANEFLRSNCEYIQLDVDGLTYDAKPIINSFSSKLIFSISPKGSKENKFILKFDPYKIDGLTDKAVKFGENQDLRPDMPYLDAMVDFYLKENKSPNAANILFYDNLTKSVLYKAEIGSVPEIPEEFVNNIYSFVNYDKIADIKRLGVELSDAHANNFIVTPDGVFKLIDSGHVKYSSVFRPPVVPKHIVTGNLCGRELCK